MTREHSRRWVLESGCLALATLAGCGERLVEGEPTPRATPAPVPTAPPRPPTAPPRTPTTTRTEPDGSSESTEFPRLADFHVENYTDDPIEVGVFVRRTDRLDAIVADRFRAPPRTGLRFADVGLAGFTYAVGVWLRGAARWTDWPVADCWTRHGTSSALGFQITDVGSAFRTDGCDATSIGTELPQVSALEHRADDSGGTPQDRG